MKLLNEREILNAVAKGDQRSFERLFYAYHPKLSVYIYRLTKDYSLTEELVQDVFIKIWKHREMLPNVNRFDQYLFRASRNLTINALRDIASAATKNSKWKAEYQEDESTTELDDLSVLLDEAIEKLPKQQKRAFILSRFEKFKYGEIAEQMEISRETVKKYLQLANASIVLHIKNRIDITTLVIYFLIK
ncbi:MAG: RNA polymerase sigma factor [Sphingobacterium sp.]